MKYNYLIKYIMVIYGKLQAMFIAIIIILFYFCSSCSNNYHPESNNENTVQSNKDTSGFMAGLEKKANEAYDNNYYEEALKYYDLLIQTDSTNGFYYFRKGNCLDYLEKTEKAIICYNKAIALNSSAADSHFNLSLIYTRSLQDSLALFHVNKYLKIKPLNPDGLELKSLILQIAQGNKQQPASNKQ